MDFRQGYHIEDLNEEGQALVAEAEAEAQQGLATMQNAKRTLKEARSKQHQVKMPVFQDSNFRPGGNHRSSTSSGSSTRTWAPNDANMQCLKRGKIGHRAANCPQKEQAQQAMMADGEAESAPFICYGEEAFPATTKEAALSAYEADDLSLTTQEAMQRGWCVVDGGATKTLGSVQAVQSVLDCNQAVEGTTKLLGVDTQRQPTFSFGNSSANRCVSIVEVGIKAGAKNGRLTIHALDQGSGPILLSVASLRSLGAIIDFANVLIVFREIDPCRAIKAKRSQSGHQLLPLSGDMYVQSEVANRAIPDLKTFLH